ncbi:precorrin-3B synthase [Intrasporangium mesophilum]
MSAAARERQTPDACPAVSRPFAAADGSIVRLRPAAQPVPVTVLAQLLDIVATQQDPSIQLTSRGALQLRGLPSPLDPTLRERLRATGLVPSPTHELVRNVVASPLSGLDDLGHCDLRPVARALDAALCADARLATLPGRFLFVLDDGRGDVIGEPFDLGVLATGPGRCIVLAGGRSHGWNSSLDSAVPRIVALAHDFLDRVPGQGVWHVSELAGPIGPPPTAGPVILPDPGPRPTGAVGDHIVVGVPLGLLTRRHVDALYAVTERVVVTPWRSLVVESAATSAAALEDAGLVTGPGSPWQRLHACTGLPGCARSSLDTRSFAAALAPVLPAGQVPVHVSGCERRCGTPRTAYVDLLSPTSIGAALTLLDQEAP